MLVMVYESEKGCLAGLPANLPGGRGPPVMLKESVQAGSDASLPKGEAVAVTTTPPFLIGISQWSHHHEKEPLALCQTECPPR